MLKALRNKMLWLNMIIISLVMIIAFSVIYIITYANIQIDNRTRLGRVPPMFSEETEKIPLDYTASFTITIDNKGNIIEKFSRLELDDEVYMQAVEKALKNKKGTIEFADRLWQYTVMEIPPNINHDPNRRPAVFDEDNIHIAFIDITESSQTLVQLFITFSIVGIAMLIIIFCISLYFANRAIRPIEESWQKQKQFVADASHELKTPLTIINSNMDVLQFNIDETVGSQKEWIGYICSETARMGKLVGDLLYLARVEDLKKDEFIPFNLSEAVATAVASMEAVIYDKNIIFTDEN